MARLNLAEELLLIATDDEDGRRRRVAQLDHLLAAAAVVDLSLSGSARLHDGDVVLEEQPGDPLGQLVAEVMGGFESRAGANLLAVRVTRHCSDVAGFVAGCLVDRGVLEARKRRLLPGAHHPERDAGPEHEIRSRLDRALSAGDADDRTGALATLMVVARLDREVEKSSSAQAWEAITRPAITSQPILDQIVQGLHGAWEAAARTTGPAHFGPTP